MIAWRICKRKYASTEWVLGGEGAKTSGGRWNRVGIAMVYASDSSSLALLETLAQVAAPTLPPALVAVSIEIPDDVAVRDVREANLPANWRDAGNSRCATIGSQWADSGSGLVLLVPSAVNPLDRNVLLNPLHAEISRCAVSPPVGVTYDSRLLALFSRRA